MLPEVCPSLSCSDGSRSYCPLESLSWRLFKQKINQIYSTPVTPKKHD